MNLISEEKFSDQKILGNAQITVTQFRFQRNYIKLCIQYW